MLEFLTNLAHNGVDHSAEAAAHVVPAVAPVVTDAAPVVDTAVTVADTAHQATEAAGGLSALGLDWKAFLFQLATFVIVLLILRKFVFGKLVATLDARQKAVDDSIKNAQATEAKLKDAEKTIAGLMADARKEADAVVAASHKEAAQAVEAAEAKAVKRAEHIVAEAKNQMDVELAKARESLKKETTKLVAAATEHIIREKLDAAKDAKLIDAAVSKAAKEHK